MKREDLLHAVNEIFKASESLREALDTLDLGGYEPQGGEVETLERAQAKTERIAQRLQAKAYDMEGEPMPGERALDMAALEMFQESAEISSGIAFNNSELSRNYDEEKAEQIAENRQGLKKAAYLEAVRSAHELARQKGRIMGSTPRARAAFLWEQAKQAKAEGRKREAEALREAAAIEAADAIAGNDADNLPKDLLRRAEKWASE